MLISIDHGNKQIKTVHCTPFVSGLQQSITSPFGKEVLVYRGEYFTLSDQRIPYRKDKTEDERFFVLSLFAIANEIEKMGHYAEDTIPIQLAVGLPPAHFGTQSKTFIQYFKGRDIVDFEYCGRKYSIYIKDVACFPQAYAAAVTMLQQLMNHPKVLNGRHRNLSMICSVHSGSGCWICEPAKLFLSAAVRFCCESR